MVQLVDSNQLDTLLTFQTTFRVTAADRALREAEIACGLTPTPPGVKSPCGLSLRIRGEDFGATDRVLQAAGIAWQARYQAGPDGWLPV